MDTTSIMTDVSSALCTGCTLKNDYDELCGGKYLERSWECPAWLFHPLLKKSSLTNDDFWGRMGVYDFKYFAHGWASELCFQLWYFLMNKRAFILKLYLFPVRYILCCPIKFPSHHLCCHLYNQVKKIQIQFIVIGSGVTRHPSHHLIFPALLLLVVLLVMCFLHPFSLFTTPWIYKSCWFTLVLRKK